MSSMLNRNSLSQKLILMAAIPMLLLIFGCLRMFDLVERLQTAQRNALGVVITEQTQKLIFTLQNEHRSLQGLGCDFVQGDLIPKAMPLEEIEPILRRMVKPSPVLQS